jgi:hypothetical protein
MTGQEGGWSDGLSRGHLPHRLSPLVLRVGLNNIRPRRVERVGISDTLESAKGEREVQGKKKLRLEDKGSGTTPGWAVALTRLDGIHYKSVVGAG